MTTARSSSGSCFAKATGEWPSVGELAPDEVETISSIGTFYPDFSTDYGGVDDVVIESVDVICDGMTRLPTLEMGMQVEEGEVRGFSCPVLRLHVTGQVSPDDLARAVEGSFVRLQPASRVSNGEEPFYCEDHQGYTGILSDDTAQKIAGATRAAGAIGRTAIPFAEFSGGLFVPFPFAATPACSHCAGRDSIGWRGRLAPR